MPNTCCATSLLLPEKLPSTSPVLAENFDVGVGGVDGLGAVDHDQIATLAFQLLHGPQVLVFGLQGEGDDPLRAVLDRRQRGHDVGRFDQFQPERLARLADLVRRHGHRPIVARRGHGDQAVAGGKHLQAGGEHVLGRDDRDHLGAGGIRHIDRPADDHHLVSRLDGRRRQRRAHAPARRVGQIPHRIEVLPRRAGGDEDAGHGGVGDYESSGDADHGTVSSRLINKPMVRRRLNILTRNQTTLRIMMTRNA